MDRKRVSSLEIAIASVQCFGDDGTLDSAELNFLLGLALRDEKVDEDEKHVLRSIFSKVTENDVNPGVWQRILAAKQKYGIGEKGADR